MIVRRTRKQPYSIHDKLLVSFLILQLIFWNLSHAITPTMDIVPPVPGQTEAKAFTFGDGQFYFRAHVLDIQNAGWTYGRSTQLKYFNYKRLYYWFRLLDTIDAESSSVPYLASYWFGRTDQPGDIRYIVNYLEQYAAGRLEKKWWWQAEAVYLADHRVNDPDLAIEAAIPLAHLKEPPIIIRELPAFIYERRGEMDAARKVMEDIKASTQLTQGELNFIDYFITERLSKRDAKTQYFDARPKMPKAADAQASAVTNNVPKYYSESEIRSMSLEGLRLGMTQEDALAVLKKDHWSGDWHPFTGPLSDFPFEREGETIRLLRMKDKDGQMHIWAIIYVREFDKPPEFAYLLYLIEQRYGQPTRMNLNESISAYSYYHTWHDLDPTPAPKLEIEMGSRNISYQLMDSSMLPEEYRKN